MTEPTTEFVFSPEVLFQPIGTESVLLNLSNNRYYGLNEVGTRMWELLQEHGTLDAVVALMVTEFEVDEPILRQDLEKLVALLIEHEMLTTASAPAP